MRIAALHASSTPVVIIVAGAGSQVIYWLHAVAGSSRTVLECVDAYAPTSLERWLGCKPVSACSAVTAGALARAARRRALALGGGERALGGALVGALATDRIRQGADRAWCAVALPDGRVELQGITWQRGLVDRLGEEAAASQLLLAMLCEAVDCGSPELTPNSGAVVQRIHEPPESQMLSVLGGSLAWTVIDAAGNAAAEGATPAGLLPGAFNPLHEGHVRLAQVASECIGAPVGFELAVENADKGRIEAQELIRRAQAFHGVGSLVISSSIRFADKARCYPGTVFVVGIDTARRVLDPRYYPDGGGLAAALDTIAGQRCSFLVAGRREGAHYTPASELQPPSPWREIFVPIEESRFRLDISSTELRNTQQ
jgi:hypothetical protein